VKLKKYIAINFDSTQEFADLMSVRRDAVYKWIKAGWVAYTDSKGEQWICSKRRKVEKGE
jgi:predicted site-specific integrase-resolvase